MAATVRYVGVDVSKDTLHVAATLEEGALSEFVVTNDAQGHQELLNRVAPTSNSPIQVVLEATGAYSVPIAHRIARHPHAEVMIAQPLATSAFAKALSQRGKTDRADARMLREFAKRMDFVAAPAADERQRSIRALGRHLDSLVNQRARVKNQIHAVEASNDLVLLPYMRRQESDLTGLIEELEEALVDRIQAEPSTRVLFERMTSFKGIAKRGAARLIPEFVTMPKSMSPRQAVAFVGLDPRPKHSGTSRNHPSCPISKRGGSRIRGCLYMLTISGARYEPSWRAYHRHLVERGKPPKVARVALMRKNLTSLWIMWTRNVDFDPKKFTSSLDVQ